MRLPGPRLGIGLLALAALTGCEAGWARVLDGLPGALISVWGASSRDVWAVGGDAGDGSGPMVVHFDGRGWTRLRTGQEGDLWWVHGFEGGPLFMGGKGGLVLRFQGGAFERLPTPGAGTVFGLWGASPSDVWAVGGDGEKAGFAWRFDGVAFRKVALPSALGESSLFKVWGTSAGDVWLVGAKGAIAHFDGNELAAVESPTPRTLFTAHGAGGRVAAVGGFGTGVLLEHDGSRWADVTPRGASQLIGVYLTEREGWAVGVSGTVMRREARGWSQEETGLRLASALHAVWVDELGGVWAVGGQVLSFPLVDGVLLHKGAAIPRQLKE